MPSDRLNILNSEQFYAQFKILTQTVVIRLKFIHYPLFRFSSRGVAVGGSEVLI